MNENSRKCLEIGTIDYKVQQWDCHWGANQQWIGSISSNVIRNVSSGQCLEIANFWTHNEAPVRQWPCYGNLTQSWNRFWTTV